MSSDTKATWKKDIIQLVTTHSKFLGTCDILTHVFGKKKEGKLKTLIYHPCHAFI